MSLFILYQVGWGEEEENNLRYCTIESLQENAGPILTQQLRKEFKVSNDLEILSQFMF